MGDVTDKVEINIYKKEGFQDKKLSTQVYLIFQETFWTQIREIVQEFAKLIVDNLIRPLAVSNYLVGNLR